jgi:hypothetical protein
VKAPTVIRLDSGPVSPVQRYETSTVRKDRIQRVSGGLLVDAAFTQTGVFEYLDERGEVRREYRPPEEVFHPDSVASLRDTTVTRLHPNGLVDPKNWKQLAVGWQRGDVQEERNATGGGALTGQMVLADASVIVDTLEEKLKENSCGYTCILDMTPGVTPEGEKYDAIQRNIRYNHIAIGPSDWGRQGATIAMRLDSSGNQVIGARKMKIKITVDGQTYEVEAGSAEHLQLQARKDAAQDAELARLRAENGTLSASVNTERGRADSLQTQLTEAPSKIAAQVAARADLETKARGVLGADFKFTKQDGGKEVPLSDDEVRSAVIAKRDPSFRADGKDTNYLQAAFDIYTRSNGSPEQEQLVHQFDAPNRKRTDSNGNPVAYRLDANDPDPEAARAHMLAHNAALATKPMNARSN